MRHYFIGSGKQEIRRDYLGLVDLYENLRVFSHSQMASNGEDYRTAAKTQPTNEDPST